MPSILLLVTGDLEWLAMRDSIGRYFSNAAFQTQKLDSLTSTRRSLDGPRIPTPMRKLAVAMLKGIDTGRNRDPFDFVFAVDDLELCNADQPHVIVEWVRRAVTEVVHEKFSDLRARERAFERVRRKCSFHFFVPMTEAYFYGDRDALSQAGVTNSTQVQVSSFDVEDFQTNDEAYLATADARRRRSNGVNPERHPKDYLEFLCGLTQRMYDETVQGRAALEKLNWPLVASPTGCVRFARALFEDLADALEVPNPLPQGGLHPVTYPECHVDRSTLVLRNL